MKKKITTLILVSMVCLIGCNKSNNTRAVITSESEIKLEAELKIEIELESETEIKIESETENITEVKLSKAQQYITELFKSILGREADKGALEYYENLLLDENKGVHHVVLILFQSEEFKNRKVDKEEFVKILFDVTLDRKASKEELQIQSKDLKDYSDYMVLLIHFLELEEFRKKVETTKIPVGSIPSINGEVVILNDGLIITTAKKYNESKDNIKFKYPVPKGKQNIVVELKVEEETDKEVETVVFQEPPQPQANINNNWVDNGGATDDTPAVVIEIPQQTQAQTEPTTQEPPQTEPQTQTPVWVVTREAWEETVPKYEWQLRMICACGEDITESLLRDDSPSHLALHALAGDPYGSWASKMVQVQVGTEIINYLEEGYWK